MKRRREPLPGQAAGTAEFIPAGFEVAGDRIKIGFGAALHSGKLAVSQGPAIALECDGRAVIVAGQNGLAPVLFVDLGRNLGIVVWSAIVSRAMPPSLLQYYIPQMEAAALG